MAMKRETYAVLLLLFWTSPGAPAVANPRSLNDLSGPWQLFVDDHVVAARQDVVRTYHPFEKHPTNPVLVADQPWEDLVYVYGTVLPAEDGSGYRIWYQNLPINRRQEVASILYATSEDGIRWEKPELGIRARSPGNPSTANNMFFPREHGNGIASIMHTPWDPDPSRQYRIMNFDEGGYWGAYSPDGIHLTDLPGNPVYKKYGDVAQFLWDPHVRQYASYGKTIHWVSGLRRRCVSRAVADEIDSWSEPELVLTPDSIDDRWARGVQRTHLYGFSAFAYESMYIGLLWIFRATDNEGYFIGPVFAEIATSRDGIGWFRQEGDRPAMLPLGPAGSWDGGQLYTATQPILVGEQLRLYYGAADQEHGRERGATCSIGLATLRKDGFASLDAAGQIGEILTRRLRVVGAASPPRPLQVNYRCQPGGWIRVEVLDEDGRPIDGFTREDCQPLQGDSIDQAVVWRGRPELPYSKGELRLRFILEDASIYSFNPGPGVEVLDEPAGPMLAVLCTMERDAGRNVSDVLESDGRQRIILHGDIRVDANPANAAFGSRSLPMGSEFSPLQTLEIDGTANLGTHFTLAVMARSSNNRFARLFSSTTDHGPVKTSELVFDCDPSGTVIPGLRLICKGLSVESTPLNFADGKYHHLAVVYDDGNITFYLDGQEAGRGRVPPGLPVVMDRNLFVGEDADHGREEQFRGHLDDILVLGRALTAEDIRSLAKNGAEATLRPHH
jgi:hypothetical protein